MVSLVYSFIGWLSGISGTTRLLDQNAEAFSQISANLSTFKVNTTNFYFLNVGLKHKY